MVYVSFYYECYCCLQSCHCRFASASALTAQTQTLPTSTSTPAPTPTSTAAPGPTPTLTPTPILYSCTPTPTTATTTAPTTAAHDAVLAACCAHGEPEVVALAATVVGLLFAGKDLRVRGLDGGVLG